MRFYTLLKLLQAGFNENEAVRDEIFIYIDLNVNSPILLRFVCFILIEDCLHFILPLRQVSNHFLDIVC